MKTIQSKKQQIIYYSSSIKASPRLMFDIAYWRTKKSVIGSAQGRGTTWFIQLQNLQGALRHYNRGGLFGRLIKDHYFFYGWKRTRSIAEFHLLNDLKKAGVNVPKPIAAQAIKKNPFIYQADLISERIPNAQDLVSVLQKKHLSSKIYRAIGKEIKKMHALQVNHTDLNIHNILIDDNFKAWLIDFDKCYKQSGDDWKETNLLRLKRSFTKELNKRNIYWKVSDWEHLLSGYQNQ